MFVLVSTNWVFWIFAFSVFVTGVGCAGMGYMVSIILNGEKLHPIKTEMTCTQIPFPCDIYCSGDL